MRFTLPKLFFAVTMAALACAGLTMRTRGWAEAIVTLSIVLYTAVALSSIRCNGKSMSFRIAFSIVGSGYLFLVLCAEPLRQVLLTDHALIVAGRALKIPTTEYDRCTQGPNTVSGGGGGFGSSGFGGTFTTSDWSSGGPFSWDRDDRGTLRINAGTQAGAFFVIGHCVWSWLLALLAGWFASFCFSRREKAQTP